jgi:hypothetical protein
LNAEIGKTNLIGSVEPGPAGAIPLPIQPPEQMIFRR